MENNPLKSADVIKLTSELFSRLKIIFIVYSNYKIEIYILTFPTPLHTGHVSALKSSAKPVPLQALHFTGFPITNFFKTWIYLLIMI